MGLTKRNDSYYVEFRVLDDGKALSLASGIQGAKLKRWKVGCLNKTLAKQQEAIIKAKLLAGTMVSERAALNIMTLGQWAEEYKQVEEVRRLRSYKERCQRIDQDIVPYFGSNRLLGDLTAKDVEAFRQERGKGRAVATVNVDHNILKHMLKQAMKRDLVTQECGLPGGCSKTEECQESSAGAGGMDPPLYRCS
jgi:hypothetical protein